MERLERVELAKAALQNKKASSSNGATNGKKIGTKIIIISDKRIVKQMRLKIKKIDKKKQNFLQNSKIISQIQKSAKFKN